MTSTEAARVVDGPVELLFIDGDHSYEAVRLDAALWLPKLIEGGTAMFHDVGAADTTAHDACSGVRCAGTMDSTASYASGRW